MKSTPFSLALRIATILEEFSDKEIRSAIAILESHGGKRFLLDYLMDSENDSESASDAGAQTSKRRAEVQRSKAVAKLESSDPAKFSVLSEFETMIRMGKILVSLEDLKRFGERFSKDFSPRKSKKETISVLMTELADRPLLEIERLVEYAASFGTSGNTDEFQHLANYIIRGGKPSEG